MAIAIAGGVNIVVLNPHVIGVLKRDMQGLAHDLAGQRGLRKPFERIRDEVMIPSIRTNFDVGGRPRWEPLSLATFQSGGFGGREAFIQSGASGIIGGRVPLTKSGQLKRAATAKARFKIRNNEMTYGDWPEKRWFGPVHNLPDLSRKAKIPNRPFTLIQEEDKVAITEIMMEWVETQVNKNIRLRYA